MKLTKREKEIIYFALSRLLDITAKMGADNSSRLLRMDRSNKKGALREWNKIDSLRDRFKDLPEIHPPGSLFFLKKKK